MSNDEMTAPTDRRMAPPADQTIARMSYEDLLEYAEDVPLQGSLVSDLDKLIDLPMIVIGVRFKEGGEFGPYSVVQAKLANDDTVIFTGGGKGFNAELREYVQRGGGWPLALPMGLRRSDYTIPDPQDKRDIPDDQKKQVPARTYYLAGGKPAEEIDFDAARALGRKIRRR